MVFYAYINRTDIADNSGLRYILVFADAATTDEWWRAVSGNSITNSIKRINPHIYTYESLKFDINMFFITPAIADMAKLFVGRFFIALINPQSVINYFNPVPHWANGSDAIDHASGNWFYIRSKVNSSMYWYYDPNHKQVVASKTDQTMFRIVGTDIDRKTIMIGSDKINLMAYPQTDIAQSANGELISGATASSFVFRAFADGHFVVKDGVLVIEDTDVDAPKKPGWELLN